MNPLPAIAIGGPPHSGKSVLTYSLTQFLREQWVEHYVLRACPDGEGDWSNEAAPETVRAIRQKGRFTPTFIENVCEVLQTRYLPLLVDVGGEPTTADEAIFRQCTHIILLSATAESMTKWRAFAQRLNLPIIAELDSVLVGEDEVVASEPLLRGRITGLERGASVKGAMMTRIAEVVRALFTRRPEELRAMHLAMAPAELAVDLDRAATTLGLKQSGSWHPWEIPALLDYLPAQTPLAIYGRGPNWLYAALALHTWPADFYQFDARLGWVKPARLTLSAKEQLTLPEKSSLLTCTPVVEPHYTRMLVQIPDTYLDYEAIQDCVIPQPTTKHGAISGVVCDGKMPHWLLCGLVQTYQNAAWIAVHQPQIGDVVVLSRNKQFQVGGILQIAAPIVHPNNTTAATLGPTK
ncbi:MAG: hypothetical protein KF832_17350 [Caldilineaceae bacterium]|nr:hypothetical protein [Caldilineaceae bacterium]